MVVFLHVIQHSGAWTPGAALLIEKLGTLDRVDKALRQVLTEKLRDERLCEDCVLGHRTVRADASSGVRGIRERCFVLQWLAPLYGPYAPLQERRSAHSEIYPLRDADCGVRLVDRKRVHNIPKSVPAVDSRRRSPN